MERIDYLVIEDLGKKDDRQGVSVHARPGLY